MTAPPLVVGTGPSELHAMIDLEARALKRIPWWAVPDLTVLVATDDPATGWWSIVAELRTRPTGRSG